MLRPIKNPARLDCKITLQSPTNAKDSIGGTNTTWATAGTVRAERLFKNSEQRYEAQQEVGATREDFRIRDYRTLYAITQQWRVVYETETYGILGIEREGRKNTLILSCLKRDNL